MASDRVSQVVYAIGVEERAALPDRSIEWKQSSSEDGRALSRKSEHHGTRFTAAYNVGGEF